MKGEGVRMRGFLDSGVGHAIIAAVGEGLAIGTGSRLGEPFSVSPFY